MYLPVSYEPEFDEIFMWLKQKYPNKLFDLDGIGKQLDMNKFSREFFSNRSCTSDVSIDDNSNVDDMSVIAYVKELPKPFFRLNSYYVLWKKLKQLYGKEVALAIVEEQLRGDIYINDFHGIGSAQSYCFNYSTFDVALQGLPMIKKIKSVAPKYLYSFKSQLEQFVTIAANSTLGATGLADMLIVMAYYVDKMKKEGHDAGWYFDGYFSPEEQNQIIELIEEIPAPNGENDEEIEKITKNINERIGKKPKPFNSEWFNLNVRRYVKENIVSFIYTVNQPTRAGLQSPFTNVSIFDNVFLEKLVGDYRFTDGNSPSIDTVKELQEMFIDVMNKELRRTPVTFPVTTACFATKKSEDGEVSILDKEFINFIAEKNQEFGFINIYCGDSSTLSSCCRLRSKQLDENGEVIEDEQKEYFNSFGSGSSKIGSLGVATINLPRIAFESETEEDFYKRLGELVQHCQMINNAKRHITKKKVENGNLPLYTLGFMDLSKQYSTVGINGFYEAITEMGYDILSPEGQQFGLDIIDSINDINDKLSKQYKSPHNCEQIPAESVSVKLCKKDQLLKIQDKYDLYSNQFIPLIKNASLLDRMELQGVFDSHFSGGAIAHLNVEQRIDNPQKIADLITTSAKMGIVYFAINYVLQQCEDGHMSVGREEYCNCGKEITDNFTRVVGYLTNTKSWNEKRRELDFPHRKFYTNGSFTWEKNN